MKKNSRNPGGERSYLGLSAKGINFDVSIDTARDRIVFKSQKEDRIIDTPAFIPLPDIEKAFIDVRKRLSQSLFQIGLILVLLIGAYLSVAEYLNLNESMENAFFIFFLGLSAIGLFLIVIYYILKHKVLVIVTKERKTILNGDLEVLAKLRFDIHVQSKGRLLSGEDELPESQTSKIENGSNGANPSIPKDRNKKELTCPHCGSNRLYYEAGLMTGYKYHCKSCHYVGPFVIEK